MDSPTEGISGKVQNRLGPGTLDGAQNVSFLLGAPQNELGPRESTAERWPSVRSSYTVTEWPALSNSSVQTDPI
jgi:hypothetical protein